MLTKYPSFRFLIVDFNLANNTFLAKHKFSNWLTYNIQELKHDKIGVTYSR